jgi:hypothetical protein
VSTFNRSIGGEPPPTQGRFPANIIHDGSEEVLSHFPNTKATGAANRIYNCENPQDDDALIYNKAEEEISKPERGIAKTANFNLVYGGSAKNLLSIINEDGEVITLEEAEHIRRTFFRLYPVFKAWHCQTWDEAKGGEMAEGSIRDSWG